MMENQKELIMRLRMVLKSTNDEAMSLSFDSDLMNISFKSVIN